MSRVRLLPTAAVFAAAMAYLEAAVVIYLRRMHGITDLMLDRPLLDPFIATVEIGREAATLVILLVFGWAAGRTPQARVGLAAFTFGIWDILYYAWLKALIGWPDSLLEPDILFLIPLPWWGPVLTPILIALLLATGGAAAVIHAERGRPVRPRTSDWMVLAAGMMTVLYAFMADALAALPASFDALNRMRPSGFRWTAFLAGLAGMTWAIGRAVWFGPLRHRGEAAA